MNLIHISLVTSMIFNLISQAQATEITLEVRKKLSLTEFSLIKKIIPLVKFDELNDRQKREIITYTPRKFNAIDFNLSCYSEAKITKMKDLYLKNMLIKKNLPCNYPYYVKALQGNKEGVEHDIILEEFLSYITTKNYTASPPNISVGNSLLATLAKCIRSHELTEDQLTDLLSEMPINMYIPDEIADLVESVEIYKEIIMKDIASKEREYKLTALKKGLSDIKIEYTIKEVEDLLDGPHSNKKEPSLYDID